VHETENGERPLFESVYAAQIGQYLNDLGWPVSAQSGRR
jgi:hypothetical protein